jgi:hypothetical protein
MVDGKGVIGTASFATQVGSGAAIVLFPQYTLIAWIALIGSSVIFFGVLAVWFFSNFRPQLPWERRPSLTVKAANAPSGDVYEQLNVLNFRPDPVGTSLAKDGTLVLGLACEVWNLSDDVMFTQLVRGGFTLQNKVSPGQTIRGLVNRLPAKAGHGLTLANIFGLNLKKPLTGNIELEFLYGADRANLNYRFIFEASLIMSAIKMGKGKIRLALTPNLTKSEHQKVIV